MAQKSTTKNRVGSISDNRFSDRIAFTAATFLISVVPLKKHQHYYPENREPSVPANIFSMAFYAGN